MSVCECVCVCVCVSVCECVSVCVCECVRVFNFKHHSIYLVVVRIELGTFGCEAKSFNPLAIFLVVRV